jgi:hypothetical protein
MKIQVSATTIAAQIEAAAIAFGNVSATTLSASVRAAIMDFSVEVGQFVRFLEPTDSFGASDLAAVQLQKNFLDAIAILEARVFAATKSKADAAAVGDSAARTLGKVFADAAQLADQSYRTTTKAISDSVGVTDDVNGASIGDDEIMSFFKVLNEQAGVSDTFVRRMDYGRSHADEISVSEVFSAGVEKFYSDGVSIGEEFVRQLQVTRAFEESPGVHEQHSIGFFRTFDSTYVDGDYFLQDYLTNPDHFFVGDQYTHLLTKGPSEQLQLSDTINTKGLTRQIEEGFGVHEVFSKGFTLDFSEGFFVTDDIDGQASAADDEIMTFTKARNEQVVLTDSVVLSAGFNRAFDDLPHVQDLAALSVARGLADTMGVASIHSIGLARLAADAASFSDSNSKSFNKGPSEQAAVTDAGSLRSQSYCDFSYFAEDFVGTSRTF